MRRSLEYIIRTEWYDDPILYYNVNHKGVTRTELKRQNPTLYEILRKRELMGDIPRTFTPLKEIIRERFNDDPLDYYRRNFKGLSRGQLKKKAPGFFRLLEQGGLINKIPTQKANYGDDALACYLEFYPGVTRNDLQLQVPGLYDRMRREGLIHHVPLADMKEIERSKSPFGLDAYSYYLANYPRLSRGQVRRVNHGLYNRLRKDGLLKKLPLLKKPKRKKRSA